RRHGLILMPLCNLAGHTQITSGASETIFIKRLSRNSRATGPNTRVPIGSPASLISTAAFESKRMYVPSFRRVSLRIRTTTQRTTLPFLMFESGAASFTLAVITSPKPARRPRSPPRGKMHCSLRAPLLSATSSMVRIPIMTSSPQFLPSKAMVPGLLLLDGLFHPCVGLGSQRRMIDPDLHRAPDHVAELPALQTTERPALDNPDNIADLRRLLLIVRIKLLSLGNNPFVDRVDHAARHFNHNGFCHPGRNHFADFFVLVRGLLALLGWRCHFLLFLLRRLRHLWLRRFGNRLAVQFFFTQHGEYARAILFQVPVLLQSFGLSHSHLEAQPKELLLGILSLLLQVGDIDAAHFFRFHELAVLTRFLRRLSLGS